jgi:hypothetical protein
MHTRPQQALCDRGALPAPASPSHACMCRWACMCQAQSSDQRTHASTTDSPSSGVRKWSTHKYVRRDQRHARVCAPGTAKCEWARQNPCPGGHARVIALSAKHGPARDTSSTPPHSARHLEPRDSGAPCTRGASVGHGTLLVGSGHTPRALGGPPAHGTGGATLAGCGVNHAQDARGQHTHTYIHTHACTCDTQRPQFWLSARHAVCQGVAAAPAHAWEHAACAQHEQTRTHTAAAQQPAPQPAAC